MKRIVFSLAFVAFLWAAGFVAFLQSIPAPLLGPPPKNDAIVVYTGGGGVRIAAGMLVLEKGGGKRLLISGVHEDTTRDGLSHLWPGARERFDCCVDLGREALSTEGNAVETRDWMQDRSYNSVTLVTSEFHMLRALAASQARMPDVTITPYPVASGYLSQSGWPQSPGAFAAMAYEYSKYVLVRAQLLPKSLFSGSTNP